ncbi:MAG: hypothetical protein ACR2PF_12505 [Rhizobiaceae bacterium]
MTNHTNTQVLAERLTRANRVHQTWLTTTIVTALLGATMLVSYAGLPIIIA